MPVNMCVYFQNAEESAVHADFISHMGMREYIFFHGILVQSSFMELNNRRPHMP